VCDKALSLLYNTVLLVTFKDNKVDHNNSYIALAEPTAV